MRTTWHPCWTRMESRSGQDTTAPNLSWRGSASMLTELVKGKTIDDVRKISKEEILSLIGGQLSAVRLKCALLSLKVLKTGVYSYLGSENNSKEELSEL